MVPTSKLPIVIIGTGLAGYSLAKEYRKLETACPLVLITQDDGHFYSKPQLSTALYQAKTPQNLIVTSSDEMQKQLAATIYTYTTVLSIDTASQTVLLQSSAGQQEIPYGKLVFAHGARPKPLPLLDKRLNHYRINSLSDYSIFIETLSKWQKLTIIGSGLVGCEFAHDLTKTALQIHIITPDPTPLHQLVPPLIGEALQYTLTNLGVTWHTHTPLTDIVSVVDKIQSDAILSAIGLNPQIALAKEAHLHVNKGIIVDSTLQTNIPHVYALGDCAEIDGLCRQYVAPILQSARALARTLTGETTSVSLLPQPISLKVTPYPIITFPPPINMAGEWVYETENQNIKALFYDTEEILRGYALSGTYLRLRQECQLLLGKSRAQTFDNPPLEKNIVYT